MYSDYLPGRIRFGSDKFTLKLPMALCREPNASANHENYRLALEQCESMLAELQNHKPSYQTRLKKMMLSRPPGSLSEDEADILDVVELDEELLEGLEKILPESEKEAEKETKNKVNTKAKKSKKK